MSAAKPKRDAEGRRRPLALLLALLALLGVAVTAWGVWSYGGPGPTAGDEKVTSVFIPRGTGVSGIAARLDEAGAIRSATAFKVAARLTGAGSSLRAGEYEFQSRASMAQVMGKIRRGEIVRHFVTVPEGVTSARVAAILLANPVLEGAVTAPPEGAVLPETYDVHRGETRAAVLKRMTDAQARLRAELWPSRKAGLPVDSWDEAVTLASIVEKETGVASERPRVAAVFVNRLRKGMRLESDPTIIYGLTGGEPLVDAQGRRRGLRRSELERPNRYSTYQIAGLPPTPIANPGRQSLAAVLNPPETDELFFVADGTGGHVFAETFNEHLANVARWRAVEAAEGRWSPGMSTTTRSPRRGLMLIVASPSGAGKTSLCRRLMADNAELSLSISVTTRGVRPGEQDGRDYHFVDQAAFQAMVDRGEFLEHAGVHDHAYGSPRAPVEAALAEGRDVLFDIDWQGARRVAEQAPADTVRVFVLPPSMAELRRRLYARAQDDAEVIERRIGRARDEIARWGEFDYVIVNDDFDGSYAELGHIYRGERIRRERNGWIPAFVAELTDGET